MLFFNKLSVGKIKRSSGKTRSFIRPRILRCEALENRELLSADSEALAAQGYDSSKSDNTVYVTTLSDASAININDGLITLREALNYVKSGTTIKFEVSGTINLVQSLSIGKNITIDASSVSPMTLNGSGQFQIMTIGKDTSSAFTATLKNISFYNGCSAEKGAALYITASASVNLVDCIFLSNTSNVDGGAIYSDTYGSVSVENTEFQNNKSLGGKGGAIYTDTRTNGSFSVISSLFIGNTSGNSDFSSGGACYFTSTSGSLEKNNISVTNSVFRQNTSKIGGAITLFNSYATVDGSAFINNSASSAGGGIYQNKDNTGLSYLNLTNSKFQTNTASSGGALYNKDGAILSQNNIFSSNTSAQCGGAVYNTEYASCLSYGDLFESNRMTGEYSGDSGGAVFSAGTLQITNAVFSKNSAFQSGGAIFNTGKMTISQSVFSQNKTTSADAYGGAIRCAYISETNSSIDNCLFLENYAVLRGGAIDVSIGTMTISNSQFRANYTDTNSVNNNGGAIYIYTNANSVILDKCYFSDNVSFLGSTIYDVSFISENANGALSINYTSFYSNNVSSDGPSGGIYSLKGYSYQAGNEIWAQHTSTLKDQKSYTGNLVLKDSNGNTVQGTIFTNPIAISNETGTKLYQLKYTVCNFGSTDLTLTNPSVSSNGGIIDISGIQDGQQVIKAGESVEITITISSTDKADVNWRNFTWSTGNGKYFQIAVSCISVQTGNRLILSDSELNFTNKTGANPDSLSYTVQLACQPISDVTVYLRAEEGINLSVNSLTFTKENWNSPQTVTVSKDLNDLSEKKISETLLSHFWYEPGANYKTENETVIKDAAAVTGLTVHLPDYVIHQTGTAMPIISEESEIIEISVPSSPVISQQIFDLADQGNISSFSITVLSVPIYRWQFNWGDGNIQNVEKESFSVKQIHYYQKPGDYQVTLTVFYYDAQNQKQTMSYTIASIHVPGTSASETVSTDLDTSALEITAVESESISTSDQSVSDSKDDSLIRNALGSAPIQTVFDSDLLLLDSKRNCFSADDAAIIAESVSSKNSSVDLAREIILNEISLLDIFENSLEKEKKPLFYL